MSESSTRVRVVSYNIHGLRDDAAAVVRVLRDIDADVVCMQEAPKRLDWRGRCAALARRLDLLYTGGGGSAGGVAMFTSVRVDVRSMWEHRLRTTPGLTRRGVVLAELAVNGVSFGAASVHLGLDPAERARHLTEITGLANRLGTSRTVLGGDMNERPTARTWARLASQYVDVSTDDDTPTFSTADPRRRIDGIFVRGDVDIVSYSVVDTSDVRVASDHRPVVADLMI